MAGLFSRLQDGLRRTRERFSLRLKEVFSGRTTVDDDLYDDLEAAMLEADMGVGPTRKVLDRLGERVRRERVEDVSQVQEIVREELRGLLHEARTASDATIGQQPWVCLVIGVNGTGKTTTIGKLAAAHARDGRKVLLCAADTFRAAAIEQLGEWADRSGARLVKHREGSDPAAVVHDALSAAEAGGHDVVLIDTAGRLHNKDNLMSELEKVRRVVGKRIDGAPHEVLLVLDGTTGQNAIVQAREFSSRVGVTALVVTKLDGTAKGGAIVGIACELALPVRWLGVGEGIDDLVPFDADGFADALVGAPAD